MTPSPRVFEYLPQISNLIMKSPSPIVLHLNILVCFILLFLLFYSTEFPHGIFWLIEQNFQSFIGISSVINCFGENQELVWIMNIQTWNNIISLNNLCQLSIVKPYSTADLQFLMNCFQAEIWVKVYVKYSATNTAYSS